MCKHSALGLAVTLPNLPPSQQPPAELQKLVLFLNSAKNKTLSYWFLPTVNCLVWAKSWSINWPHCIVMKVASLSGTLLLLVTVVETNRVLGKAAPDWAKRIAETPVQVDPINIWRPITLDNIILNQTIGIGCWGNQTLVDGVGLSIPRVVQIVARSVEGSVRIIGITG
jgi:hypothetical protein